MTDFYCLVSKIWNRQDFMLRTGVCVCVCVWGGGGGGGGLFFFLRVKNNITFLCRFVIKYSQLFFPKSYKYSQLFFSKSYNNRFHNHSSVYQLCYVTADSAQKMSQRSFIFQATRKCINNYNTKHYLTKRAGRKESSFCDTLEKKCKICDLQLPKL